MRLLIQRCSSACVTVDKREVGRIGKGLAVLVGIHEDDTDEDAKWCARKLVNIRLWPKDDGKKQWHESVVSKNFDLLLVSQFTLHAKLKGNKPDFHYAM